MEGVVLPLVETHESWDPDSIPPEGVNLGRWGTGAADGYTDDLETPVDEGLYNQGPSATAGTPAVERYREIMAALGATIEETEIAALVLEAEQLLADELVFIPLFVRKVPVVTRTCRLSAPPGGEVANNIRPAYYLAYRTDLGDQARYQP